ncbi:MAG TPA: subclass B1 metallo-beta-lactamase [Bacteroidales bacterium]|jgi:metallo-beta-lactamase class B|nr:subclass B1 metallo-beta-lactamase [Bacteroidales bacterium]
MKSLILFALSVVIPLNINPQELIKVSTDIELVRISDNAYLHVSYASVPGFGRVSANGLVFINDGKALLFDTPWNDSLTCDLVTYLTEKMHLKIEGFVPNHWHEDCMGGLGYLKSLGIRTWANFRTIEIAGKQGLQVPDEGFSDSLALKLGDKTVFCYYPGAAHSMDNIVIWIPSEKILFPGCMCKSLDSPNLGNIADGSISEYQTTIDRVIKRFREAILVIPGHGSPGGTDLLLHTKELTSK